MKLFPGNAFNWSFLDDNINSYYQNEKIARNQILLFSVLVIAISCLGLLGMTMQRILLRTKEIGVRKIMGARTTSYRVPPAEFHSEANDSRAHHRNSTSLVRVTTVFTAVHGSY